MTIEVFLSVLLAGLSLLLFSVSALSYKRVGSVKILLISFAFLFFFIKGMVLIISLLTHSWDEWGMRWELVVFDVIVIVLLYLSIAKK